MSDNTPEKARLLIKEVVSETLNEYRPRVEALEKAIASGNGTAELRETIEKMDSRLNELQTELDAANATIKASAFTTGSDKGDRLNKEYRDLFARKLIKGDRLSNAEESLVADFHKAMNVGTANQGGHLLPTDLASEIQKQIEVKVPFLALADTRNTTFAESSYLVQVTKGATVVGTETTGASDSTTPTIEEVLIRAYHIEAEPRITRELIEDAAFDVLAFIRDEVADTIADKFGALIVTGSGSGEPRGILTAGGASSTYQQVKEITAATPAAGVPAGRWTLDDMYDVKYDVDRRYKTPGSTAWVMGDQAFKLIRKLKDVDGQYLWQPSHQLGEPGMFDGEPVHFTPNMPALTATANLDAMIYGNFRKGLGLVRHVGGDFVVVDEVTDKKYVKFYHKQRWGAGVVDARALRILRTAPVGA